VRELPEDHHLTLVCAGLAQVAQYARLDDSRFRTIKRIPDAPILHQAVLAYASDYSFLPTSLLPHGIQFRDPRLQIASLDHTLWMHRSFRADEWLLYVCDSPVAHGARGFVRGQVFSRDGALVASVAQEGLIRMRTKQ